MIIIAKSGVTFKVVVIDILMCVVIRILTSPVYSCFALSMTPCNTKEAKQLKKNG